MNKSYKVTWKKKMVFLIPHLNKDTFKSFIKNSNHVKTIQRQTSLTMDYRIILGLNFLWQLPYTPDQVLQKDLEESQLFVSLTVLNLIIKTLLSVPLVIYSRFLFVYTSLMINFSIFLLFSLAVSWNIFRKRKCIFHAIKMILAISGEINSRKFKSKWNIYLLLILNISGFLIFSTTCTLTTLKVTYPMMNTSSSYFFSYKITPEYERTFSAALIFTAAFIFTANGLTSSLVVLLSSTMYFHLGDIIFNFRIKLKKRLEYQQMTQHVLLQSLLEFKKIVNLNQKINDALSLSVSFTYGATVNLFFTGLCSIRSFGFELTELILLDLSMFTFSLFSFFSMTLTGDRVQTNHEELKHNLISTLYLILKRTEKRGNEIKWFSLLSSEIKSYNLNVTGGNMFIISNSLILSVAGALITYGVLIFQMD